MNCGVYEQRAFVKQYIINNTRQYIIPQNTIFTINYVEQHVSKLYIYIHIDIFTLPLIIVIDHINVLSPFIFDSIDMPIIINTQSITSI
jgi:hypothetical protein